MPIKTDRNDARAIAQVMRVGWHSIVHIKSGVSQEMRMLLANRKTLLIKQIDIENEIRGTLRVFGLKLAGRITRTSFEERALDLVADKPRLMAMLSKCGDALLRATLYQAALALLTRTQRWSTLRAWGMAVAKRRGLRRAVVAVARKLAIVLHRIWADGSEFRWSRQEAIA